MATRKAGFGVALEQIPRDPSALPLLDHPRKARCGRRMLSVCGAVALVTASMAGPSAHAAEVTWDGGGLDANWLTPANWLLDLPPNAGDDLTFAGAVQPVNTNDLAAGTAFNNITFATDAAAFTLNGNAITLNGSVTNNSALGQTINLATILSAGPHAVTNRGAARIRFGGIVSGTGSLLLNGTGPVELGAANTFSGGVTLSSGVATLGNAASLGTGTFTVGGGIVESGGGRIVANAMVAAPGTTTTFRANGGDSLYSGSLSGSGNVTVSGTVGATVLLTGNLSGFSGTISHNNINGGNNFNISAKDNTALNVDLSNAKVFLTGLSTGTNRAFSPGERSRGIVKFGELAGDGGRLSAAFNGAGILTYEIGHLNTNSTFGGIITGNAGTGTVAVTKVGSGTLTLTNTNEYTQATTISGGTLAIGTGGTTGTLGTGPVVNNSILSFNRSNDFTVANAISGTGVVNKLGAGTVTFTGTKSYSGATNITTGGLLLNTSLPDSDVSMAAGTTLRAGTAATTVKSLSLAGSNSILSLVSGGASTLTSTNAISIGGGTTLNFEVGGFGTDRIVAGAPLTVSGPTTVNLIDLFGIQPGTYDLISFTSGSDLSQFTLGDRPSNYDFSLATTPTALQLVVVGVAAPDVAYWTGDQSNVWNTKNGSNTNWATDATLATDTEQLPATNTEVNFNAISAPLVTTLGSNRAVKSLKFGKDTVNSASVEIGGANNLQVWGAEGIKVFGGSATNAISIANLDLMTSQSITNNSTGTLTISSAIGSPIAGAMITVDGTGTVLLSGNNTFNGGINIASGTLQTGHVRALGNSAVTMSGGTLDLFGNATTVTGVITATGGTISNSTGAGVVTFNGGNIAAPIQDGGGTVGVTLASGILVLTGNNTYTGGTTINGGTLRPASSASLAGYNVAGRVVVNNTGALVLTAGGVGQWDGPGIDAVATTATFNAGSAFGIQVDAGNTFDFQSAFPATVPTFRKTGAGLLILSGGNAVADGIVQLQEGTTKLNHGDALGSFIGNTTVSAGATLDLNGQFIFENFGVIAGTGVGGVGALVNTSEATASVLGTIAGNQPFTVGNGNIELGRVSGGGGIHATKIGTGTLTFNGTGDNGFLNVTVTSGTVVFAKTDNKSSDGTNVGAAGTLRLGHQGGAQQQINNNSSLLLNGTFDLNGFNETIAGLNGTTAAAVVTNGAAGTTSTFTIGNNNVAGSYAGTLQNGAGTLALVKAGTANVVLLGDSGYTGGTTVQAGTLTASHANAIGRGNLTITGGSATLTAGLAAAVPVTSLSITSPGVLELNDNSLVIDYADASPIGDVRTLIGGGRIISSTLASNLKLGIGYGEKTGTFKGVTIDGGGVAVLVTLRGDANLDSGVNFADLVALAQNYNQSGKVWAQGDFNYDALVNFADLVALAQNYNQSLAPAQVTAVGASFAADFALAQSLVPEPTAALGLLASLGTLSIRRRGK